MDLFSRLFLKSELSGTFTNWYPFKTDSIYIPVPPQSMGILLMLIGIIMAGKGLIPKEKFNLDKVIEKVEKK